MAGSGFAVPALSFGSGGVYSGVCPLGDAASPRDLGLNACGGALWHLVGKLDCVRRGLFGGRSCLPHRRHWLRDWTSARLERFPKLQAIEKGVSREGLKLVMLTRLSPAFPFSLLNLAYGLSDVSLRDYTIGLVAILPGTVLFCALGALAGDAARFGEVLAGETSPGAWVLRIVGVLATLAVVWLAGRAARKALADQEGGL